MCCWGKFELPHLHKMNSITQLIQCLTGKKCRKTQLNSFPLKFGVRFLECEAFQGHHRVSYLSHLTLRALVKQRFFIQNSPVDLENYFTGSADLGGSAVWTKKSCSNSHRKVSL